MWTRLKSMSQIRRLQEDAELLHEPLPGSTNGTYHSGNHVYKVKKIDGDTVVLRGWCDRPGHVRIGFGECRGTVIPARASSTIHAQRKTPQRR